MQGVLGFAGETTVYYKQPAILLPPGSALRIGTGNVGSPANPAILRLGVSIPNQEATLAQLGAINGVPGIMPVDFAVVSYTVADTGGAAVLDDQGTYYILSGGDFLVTLPPSNTQFYWGPANVASDGTIQRIPRRSGRVFFVENQGGDNITFTRSTGDTINGVAADVVAASELFLIVNRGDGDWRVNPLGP
jgi:hypothetical protein